MSGSLTKVTTVIKECFNNIMRQSFSYNMIKSREMRISISKTQMVASYIGVHAYS